MSLQFLFGNSGSGKSGYLYEYILEQARLEPEQNFLILVPEQFTMQTQRELVQRQKNHAIMNVDVLSFARLAYRVFDELGKQELVILEETGKNLILRKVAEQKKKELHVLGANMNKMGYIGEVKSLLSELTQYNISPDELECFLAQEDIGEVLKRKLSDVLVMYRGFREYLEGKYVTSEEVLSLLCEVAAESEMLKGSVIVFDEFTGFTPIQNRLLGELLVTAEKIMVSLTMDTREDFFHAKGLHELFAMSKKTAETLVKTASKLHVEIEDAVVLAPGEHRRYEHAPDLFFMEQNLFRPGSRRYQGAAEHISITGLNSPREELKFAAGEITRLVREKGYCYKEIALVTGDVPQYANYVPEIFENFSIPYFIDQTKNILFHPFIEFLRAALETVEYDFSYESIFRFLRCGLADGIAAVAKEQKEEEKLTWEEIDRLENYVLAKGIRGRKRWSRQWTLVLPDGTREDMPEINRIRESIYACFEPLFEVFKGRTAEGTRYDVRTQTYALYCFICSLDIEARLKKQELEFQAAGNLVKAREYAQIYKIVMDLLDKVASLLGEERLTIREYSDILDAGFEAAKVGVIPSGNDKVTIGDIERSRLNHIKVLFFVGVNDGVVPKAGNAGGIISQFEREKMTAHHLELAPGAREKVFIQKFYLYLNMTKPSDLLYVTFSKVNADGKALRCSYLIGTLFRLFPDMQAAERKEQGVLEEVLTPQSSMQFFLEGLQQDGFLAEEAAGKLWAALANWYLSSEDYREEAARLLAAANLRYQGEPISKAVTRALYGTVLENSVTRLERFASCALSHYLSYGLHLKERQLYEFAAVDIGNLYHDALEHFARRVLQSEYTWFDIPEKIGERWRVESIEDAVAGCKNAGIFEDAKNRYLLERMKETIRQTVWALTVQIQKGHFVPSDFEVAFSDAEDLSSIQFTLSEEEKMHLRGRIDRVDTYETKDKVYVKIIDYKSGNTSFSLLNLYHGLQLQLVVYLNAAMEMAERKYPKKTAQPAGIFYYHIENPMVEGSGTESEEEIRRAVLEQLKMNGLVNEDPEVYRAMDTDFTGSSAVIPVSLKTDGSLKAASKTASTFDFHAMSKYVNERIVKAGRAILDGDAAASPYQLDQKTGCDYCPYHTVCGFDIRIPGFSYRKLEKFDSAEEILEKIKKNTSEKGA